MRAAAHQHHGAALAEEEGLAGDDGDGVGGEMGGNLGEGAVVAGEDGDVPQVVAKGVDKMADVGEHLVPEGCAVGFEFEKAGLQVAALFDGLLAEGRALLVADINIV